MQTRAALRITLLCLAPASFGGCVLNLDGTGKLDVDGDGSSRLVVSSDWVSDDPVHVAARQGGQTCTGAEASRTFTNALCVCGDLGLAGSLSTGSFDAAGAESESGGAVGVNGALDVAGRIDVGSLSVGRSIGLAGDAEIHGDARIDGDLDIAGVWHVQRDAWVRGAIAGAGDIVIDRDLHALSTSDTADATVYGDRLVVPFVLAPPCPCGDDEIVDVAALVREAATNNDDALRGVSPGALASVLGEAVAELPSGRVYLDAVDGAGDVVLVVHGRTAVFVGGDVSLAGSLRVELDPDAELDLYVAGAFDVAGSVELGGADRPHATRLWIGAEGYVGLAGSGKLYGDLYAPRATLGAAGDLEIVGSAFVAAVDLAGSLDVTYDREILDAGDACDLPEPTTCASHLDCAAGQACLGGTCGACTTDADCGCGLVCSAGSCGALLL